MLNSATAFDDLARQISALSGLSFLNDVQLSDGLTNGSVKNAAVIACSDMGFSLPYIGTSGQVPLYIFQDFGPSVSTAGVIETIIEKRIEHIVVYGHSDCDYLKYGPASHVASDSPAASDDVARYNVLQQLEQLLDHPVIGPAAGEGKLTIHGWFYCSKSSRLEVFDPKTQSFVKQSSKFVESDLKEFVRRHPC